MEGRRRLPMSVCALICRPRATVFVISSVVSSNDSGTFELLGSFILANLSDVQLVKLPWLPTHEWRVLELQQVGEQRSPRRCTNPGLVVMPLGRGCAVRLHCCSRIFFGRPFRLGGAFQVWSRCRRRSLGSEDLIAGGRSNPLWELRWSDLHSLRQHGRLIVGVHRI